MIDKNDQRIHYVYIYFRPWNGQPCYVGVGRGKRWKHHNKVGANHENKHFANIFKKAGGKIPVVKIRESLTRSEALEIEIALIAALGRQSEGGPLVNLTLGGDGGHGTIWSEEARKQRGLQTAARWQDEAYRERMKLFPHPSLGKPLSEETKKKISDARLEPENNARIRKIMKTLPPPKSIPHTPEWNANISAGLKGKPKSASHIANLKIARASNPGMAGKRHTEESIQKMREARKLQAPCSNETKVKMAEITRNRTDIGRGPDGRFFKKK